MYVSRVRYFRLFVYCVEGIVPLVFLDRPFKEVEVRLGKLRRSKTEPKREQKIKPESIIIHPHYSSDTFDSDLALIHLQKDANYTRYVRPICLPLRKEDADDILLKPGREGIVTGWGLLSEPKSSSEPLRYPDMLQKVTVPVVNQTVCREANTLDNVTVKSNMFCAGYREGGRDVCYDDSGGPLAIENSRKGKRRRWVLEGCRIVGHWLRQSGKVLRIYQSLSVFPLDNF